MTPQEAQELRDVITQIQEYNATTRYGGTVLVKAAARLLALHDAGELQEKQPASVKNQEEN